MNPVIEADVLVIGGGIAGASIAYFMAPHANVVVLEREAHVGVHSTGRSAALFSPSYGSEQVRALTRASRPFLDAPPKGFARHPILSPRGALIIASEAKADEVRALYESIRQHSSQVHLLDGAAVRRKVPALKPEFAHIGFDEPEASDIDVNELHQAYLRGMRSHGSRLICDVPIASIERSQNRWSIGAGEQIYRAPLLVNAAGAWVDEVARLAGVAPIGIQPKRRSAFIFAAPTGIDFARWPLVIDVDETFYFKPDAGMLLGSSANADPVPPHDVQPEAFDIALAIHRIQEATTLTIPRPTRTWAGLRSFVADGDLVGGFAKDAAGFFWVAAQGGYGIQTSAAMGEACACIALSIALPARLQDAGISAAMLAPR
jgi:D-arginine dehydrogenase